MQTPVHIDFQGLDSSQAVRARIDEHVTELETRYGRITACRVALKGPGQHHRIGQYAVSIRLTLPDGREVNVGRTPFEDERHTNLDFALNDAFKRARRRLQDRVRRMQGKVKLHDGPPIGTITSVDPSHEFGFLAGADGQEVYFHRNSVLDGIEKLMPGARVTYAEEMGEKGPQASTVRVLGKHTLRT